MSPNNPYATPAASTGPCPALIQISRAPSTKVLIMKDCALDGSVGR